MNVMRRRRNNRTNVIGSLGDAVCKPPDLGGVEAVARAHSHLRPWVYFPTMFVYGWICGFVFLCLTVALPVVAAYEAILTQRFAMACVLLLLSMICLRWNIKYVSNLSNVLKAYITLGKDRNDRWGAR